MSSSLAGLNVLIAEDEVIIAYDLAQNFENAGAAVTVTHTLKDALAAVRLTKFNAALIDVKLGPDMAGPLCALLQCMNVPFVIYSGWSDISGFRYKTCIVQKPATFEELATKLAAICAPKIQKVRTLGTVSLTDRVARMSKKPVRKLLIKNPS